MRAALLLAPCAAAASTSSGRQPQPFAAAPQRVSLRGWRPSSVVRAHRVELQMPSGALEVLEVGDDEFILDAALDKGLDIPHDCKMGVCLRCAAKLEEGEVIQEASMLSDDVEEKGFALLCVSTPKGSSRIRVIPEEELMDEAMATSAANEAAARA